MFEKVVPAGKNRAHDDTEHDETKRSCGVVGGDFGSSRDTGRCRQWARGCLALRFTVCHLEKGSAANNFGFFRVVKGNVRERGIHAVLFFFFFFFLFRV